MDRLPRSCQPKELEAPAHRCFKGGSPCRHSPIRPPAVASSCSFWPAARCWPPEDSRPSPGKGPRPAPSFPIRSCGRRCETEDLIKSPKEAINVFDFEPVMRAKVPPAHFGYMASGIDDEVTLRANREDFLKFQLRPRRLVDVSKVDMSVEILGVKYDTPDRAGAGRRPEGLPRGGRGRDRARRQGRQSPADSLDRDDQLASRTSPPRAARRSGISSTPPTNGTSPRPS